MVKVIVHKSGKFSFDGINIEDVEKGRSDMVASKAVVICQTDWADYDANKSEPKPVAQEEPAKEQPDNDGQSDLSIDWDFVDELVAEEDKNGLDEYAETFGIKLNRRYTIENMLKQFKESV